MRSVNGLRRFLSFESRRWTSSSSSAADSEHHRIARFADSTGLGPKRFYKNADVDALKQGLGFVVRLDKKDLRTPQRKALAAPSKALAVAVAAEWDCQGARVRPSSMPVYQLLVNALDIVPFNRDSSTQSLLRYIDTDTVCYRTTYPMSLAEEQERLWDPVVKYVHEKYQISLQTTKELTGVDQAPEAKTKLNKLLTELDDIRFAAMESAVATSKSFAIGLALLDGFLNADQALEAARCDEEFQARVWGEVEGGHDMDSADCRVRLAAASTVFRTSKGVQD
ncbi:hypothetical protein NDN08_004793 [Rhodosorus marinus]|uniref:ATP synthase mitochondrial F1 complex assembly factor 2 n=1 Tax=Rhodosorus marinus TaxID=101924 RepID=A0AAV8UQV7_9RHOD|nr:hypothetical protein NDN08_004793 [Rhodosorus marinus]